MFKQFLPLFGSLAALAAIGSPLHAQSQSSRDDERASQRDSEGSSSNSDREDSEDGKKRRASDPFEPSVIRDDPRVEDGQDRRGSQRSLLESSGSATVPPPPNEFEIYVARMTGRTIGRFGSDLLLPSARDYARTADATIPPDYRLNVGDTISISLTGSAEGSVERTIDQRGRIFLPSVGEIQLAGVRQGDLKDVMMRAIGTQFRNFRVGVRTTELRGLRVFVTGYPRNPGAFSVGSLSTAFNAILQAGGPATGGSMRNAKLIRDGREVANIDLYDIMLKGNRSIDSVLENEDVIVIPPALPQFAVWGSVQREAIFEMRPGETLADGLRFAGGANELADISRVIVYSSVPGSAAGPRVVQAAEFAATALRPGDIIQVLPLGSLVQPVAEQSVLVRVEGEVHNPGNYYVAPNTPLQQIVELAGGMTKRAYPFGTEFQRQSVRLQQRRSFEDALDLFELSLATAPLLSDSSFGQAEQQAQLVAARSTLAQLRKAEPDGRLILKIAPGDVSLPAGILLEDGDRVYIPPQPTSVGVFGAVYRPASFQLIEDDRRQISDYIEMAGSTLRAADKGGIFLVRANGSVLSRKEGALRARALPGDVIFVPIQTTRTDIFARIAQLTPVLFQAGLAAATITAIAQ
jgi:polysaccharide biosynthesis/export protein